MTCVIIECPAPVYRLCYTKNILYFPVLKFYFVEGCWPSFVKTKDCHLEVVTLKCIIGYHIKYAVIKDAISKDRKIMEIHFSISMYSFVIFLSFKIAFKSDNKHIYIWKILFTLKKFRSFTHEQMHSYSFT